MEELPYPILNILIYNTFTHIETTIQNKAIFFQKRETLQWTFNVILWNKLEFPKKSILYEISQEGMIIL